MKFSLRLGFLSFGLSALFITQANAQNKEVKYVKHESFYDKLPTAKKGGILNLEISGNPKVLNPVLSDDSNSNDVIGYLFSSLMDLNYDTLEYLPALANSYTISSDNKDYTFNLNKDAKWHDGSAFTAEDIKFTLDKIMDPKVNAAAMRSYYEGWSVKVIDTHTVLFHIEKPQFDTLYQIIGFIPIQKKQFEASKDFNNDKGVMTPIGNTAYKIEKFSRGQHIVLKRDPSWWGNKLSHYKNRFNVDEIKLNIIEDPNLAYEKFIKNEIDKVSFTSEQWKNKVLNLDKDKISQKYGEKSLFALKQENKSPKPYYYIGWNQKNQLFQSAKTRTALSYLIDYKKILENAGNGMYAQATSPFGSFTANSSQDLRKEGTMITTNKAKGMALLKEEGWKNDGKGKLVKEINGKTVPFEFELVTNLGSPFKAKVAQIVKEDLKQAGITVNVKIVEFNNYLSLIDKRSFEANVGAWTGTNFPNPKQLWHSESEKNEGSNFISYKNPKVDELIEKSNTEFDMKKRFAMMNELNKVIYEDQPYTFIAEVKYVLEGLNTKIDSPKWLGEYNTASDFSMYRVLK